MHFGFVVAQNPSFIPTVSPTPAHFPQAFAAMHREGTAGEVKGRGRHFFPRIEPTDP